MNVRQGLTLPELILVLCLFGLVAGPATGLLVRQIRAARDLSTRIDAADAYRTVRVILAGDLRWMAEDDLATVSADSLRGRMFRGGGPVCASGDSAIGVRYRGMRVPDPAKDSILVLDGYARAMVRALRAVRSGACDGSGVFLYSDAGGADGARYALVFETGAYHLQAGALRYRIGAGGRQPLTDTVLGDASFVPLAGPSLWVDAGGPIAGAVSLNRFAQ